MWLGYKTRFSNVLTMDNMCDSGSFDKTVHGQSCCLFLYGDCVCRSGWHHCYLVFMYIKTLTEFDTHKEQSRQNTILTLSTGLAIANNVEWFSLHCFSSVLTLWTVNDSCCFSFWSWYLPEYWLCLFAACPNTLPVMTLLLICLRWCLYISLFSTPTCLCTVGAII